MQFPFCTKAGETKRKGQDLVVKLRNYPQPSQKMEALKVHILLEQLNDLNVILDNFNVL